MRRGLIALGLAGTLGVIYHELLRRPILTWGATDVEATSRAARR